MQKFNAQEGQGLLEAVVALSVAVLVIVALVKTVISSINTNDFSKKKILSAHIAQQAMEKVRGYRDSNNWQTFENNCGNPTVLGLSIPSEYEEIFEDISIQCTEPVSDKRLVTITVSWIDSKGQTHSSIETTYFTSINQWQ